MDKINLDPICDNEEENKNRIKMQRYARVIDEYSEFCGVDFRKESNFNDDYQQFDFLFQITVVNPKYFNAFHDIFSKNGFSDKAYIEYAIKKIAKNSTNAEAFVNGLLQIGILSDVCQNEDSSITVKTFIDNYTFFAADEYYKDNETICEYIENGDLICNCHQNALFLLETLGTGKAITARCSIGNGDEFFHSYYVDNGMVCDLNINCVMEEEQYKKIYNPKVMSTVDITNLGEKKKTVKENATSTLNELLEIAIYEEYLKNKER